MTFVQEAVIFLDRIGMWDVVLPFILVFTVSYAVLEKTKVLGKEADGSAKHLFNAIVSFVIGFFALLAADVLNVVNLFSQWMVLLVLAAVCLAVIFSFFGFTDVRKTRYGKFFMPVAFFIFGILVLYVFGWLGFFDLGALRRYEGVIVGLVIFFVLMWYILRAPKKETDEEKTRKAAEEKKRTEEEKKKAETPASQPKMIDLNKLASTLPPKAAAELKEQAAKMGAEGPVSFEELLERLSDESKAEIMSQFMRQAPK